MKKRLSKVAPLTEAFPKETRLRAILTSATTSTVEKQGGRRPGYRVTMTVKVIFA